MNRRLSIVSAFFVMFLIALLWGALGRGNLQAARPAVTLDVPFFSQTALKDQTVSAGRAPTLGNSDLPLWEYGCGVASLAMVYRHYGVDTDVTRLNDALRASGGFSGGLLAWDKTDAFLQAGAPWVKAVERINTTRPQDYSERIAAALDKGEPVIAYLNGQHYVVLTGKEGDNYTINDPWAVSADTGKAIGLDNNLLKKGGFASIRQLVFVSRQEYTPTNRVTVQGAIREKYGASRGSQGPLGNPTQAQESLTGGGAWQRFERGAIFAPANGQPVMLHGPLWEKFQAEGGVAKLGLPQADVYSYFVGPGVTWRADFANASLLWSEGTRPNQARVVDASSGVRADYFANADLSGQPAYSRWEEGEPLFDWGGGAPGPWVGVDNFSARYTQRFAVGGVGWWYNFVVIADDGVRVTIDDDTVLDAWSGGPETHKFRSRLGRGEHTLIIEYRERSGPASLRFARSDWPATPVFAADETLGSFETLPASVAASLPDLGTPIAQATATAAGIIATLTAEARITPTPDNKVAVVAQANFQRWATSNGEPFRDERVEIVENDGFFAGARVIAWFRPGRTAPWEEREASVECRQVGGEWQCDEWFAFALTQGELARRAQARAAATATAQAAAGATAQANMPVALRDIYTRFGLEFVPVPAGEFLMGFSEAQMDILLDQCIQSTDNHCERDWFENPTPQHTVVLDDFWIGQTEVTNAQYRAFVEAGGYTQSDMWTATGWEWRKSQNVAQPFCWDDEQWNQADYPVACVSWYEATAYTRWLAQETELPIRLPSEAEWEKAARGIDGRLWPWGTQLPDGSQLNYCDVNCEDYSRDTNVADGYSYVAPVGSYPTGSSPYGVLDMAGNVWEWTSNAWGGCDWPGTFAYPYRSDDGREDSEGSDCRVVRGGAWTSDYGLATAVVRHWQYPNNPGWNDLGFRVVVSAFGPVTLTTP